MTADPNSPYPELLTHITKGWRSWAAVAAIAAVSSVTLLLVLSVIGKITEPAAFAPLYGPAYDKPQPVQEQSVPAGGVLHVTATKCTHQDVDVYGQITWRRIDPTVLLRPNATPSTRVFKEGCITGTYANEVPVDLPPGLWTLTAVETAVSGTHEQRTRWTTEPFTVTGPEVAH